MAGSGGSGHSGGADSVSGVVFGLPVVHEGVHNGVPVAGALRVIEHGLTEHVLVLLRRHHREVPSDLSQLGVLDALVGVLDERIVGLDVVEGLERGGEAHVFAQSLLALVGADDPLEELKRGLLVGVGDLGVDAPVVLGAGGEAFGLVVDADVNREHAQGIGLHAGLLQVAPGPGAVLVERSLAQRELRACVIAGLRAQLSLRSGRIGDVQVEDVLEVVHVHVLDGRRRSGDVVLLELVVQRDVGQVGLETPIGAGVEAGRGEGAFNAEVLLALLHVVGDLLERVEVLDLISGLDDCAVQRDVLVDQILVVDDAVGLNDVRDANDLAVIALEGERLVVHLLVDVGVGQVGRVALPVLVARRAVHLENRGGFALGEFGLELLLIGARGSRLHLDLHAGLIGVFLGQGGPLVGRFRLEVQEVDASFAIVSRRVGATATCGERDGHCRDGKHTYSCLHRTIHRRTFLCTPVMAPYWCACQRSYFPQQLLS